jgi:EmrB/QacA subfamily drug resistance transporter
MSSLRARLARKPPGYRLTIGRVLAVYGAIMLALLLAALDQTIVATALPRIVSDLGGLTSYSWVITSYILAMTVTVPLYGKLGDIYGRRPLYIVAISIFLAGSALCGLAQSLGELVAFRVVQGLGAGGLFALAHATIGVIVPPRDRGRYQGLIGATFAAGSILGPALGGLIVDHASWRWVFYVNLPVGAVALVVIAAAIPKRAQRREHSLDLVGATLLAAGTTALLFGLVWGGEDHPWASAQVLGSFLAAIVLLTAFAFVERRAPEPILPFDLLRRPTVAAGTAAIGLSAMAMVGTIAFVPLFVQGVIGTSATSSGVVLTPFMLGAVVASALSGQWVTHSGRYRPNALAGPIVLGFGLFLLSRMDTHTTNAQAAFYMVVAGVGLGLMMQVFVIAVQNVVPLRAMGSATALTQFSRSIGATVGVTAMGVIINQGLPAGADVDRLSLHRLPPDLRAALADAMQPAFLAAAGLCVVVLLIVALWLREVPLRRDFEEEPAIAVPEAATPHVRTAGSEIRSG